MAVCVCYSLGDCAAEDCFLCFQRRGGCEEVKTFVRLELVRYESAPLLVIDFIAFVDVDPLDLDSSVASGFPAL